MEEMLEYKPLNSYKGQKNCDPIENLRSSSTLLRLTDHDIKNTTLKEGVAAYNEAIRDFHVAMNQTVPMITQARRPKEAHKLHNKLFELLTFAHNKDSKNWIRLNMPIINTHFYYLEQFIPPEAASFLLMRNEDGKIEIEKKITPGLVRRYTKKFRQIMSSLQDSLQRFADSVNIFRKGHNEHVKELLDREDLIPLERQMLERMLENADLDLFAESSDDDDYSISEDDNPPKNSKDETPLEEKMRRRLETRNILDEIGSSTDEDDNDETNPIRRKLSFS